jgi:hypothetical protein
MVHNGSWCKKTEIAGLYDDLFPLENGGWRSLVGSNVISRLIITIVPSLPVRVLPKRTKDEAAAAFTFWLRSLVLPQRF